MARAVMHVNRGGVGSNYWDAIDVPDDATLEQAAVLALTHLARTLRSERKNKEQPMDTLRQAAWDAINRLASYVDGHQGPDDQWLVMDAYDSLYRAMIGPRYQDKELEAADLTKWRERWDTYNDPDGPTFPQVCG